LVRTYSDAARRWVPLLIVGGLLGVAAIAASVATPGVHTIPFTPESTPSDDTTSGAPPGGQVLRGRGAPVSIPAWVGWIEVGLASLFVALVIAVLVWHFLRNHWVSIRQVEWDRDDSGDAMSVRPEEVIAALDEGIALLTSDRDARSAVIACWVRLEEVASDAGTPRLASDAPADLVTRLLAAHRVSRAALTSLADLYRVARYSTAPVDDAMRSRALSALGQVRGQIVASMTDGGGEDIFAPSHGRVRPGVPTEHTNGDRPRP
jgi:hypothetical protein